MFNDDGDTIYISTEAGTQLLVISGEPIGEAISMDRSFVMNTRTEIETANEDYSTDKMKHSCLLAESSDDTTGLEQLCN